MDTKQVNVKELHFEEAPPVAVSAPYSREAEDAIIGAVIINPVEIDQLVIDPQDFYIRRNQVIWEALISLHRKGTGIDYVTLLDELEDKGHLETIGGSGYVAGLMANVGYVSDVKAYEKIIRSYSKRRAILSVANDVAKIAYGEESDAIDDQLGEIVSRLLKHSIPDKGLVPISKALTALSNNVDERYKNPKDIWGIPTGFIDIDNYLGGLQKGEVFYLAGEPAVGKCLGKGTRIVMYDGSTKPVESIFVNDLLMGVDSKPRKVLSVAQGTQQMYLIKQEFGISYRVNADHILSFMRSRNCRGYKHGDLLYKRAEDAYNEFPAFFANWKGHKTSIEFKDSAVPLDPYFIGLWLGDGNEQNSYIHTSDQEVVQYLESLAIERGEKFIMGKFVGNNKSTYYGITSDRTQKGRNKSIQALLRKLGVINFKHIPKIYLINSRQKRLLLLAGLIDSDGYYPKGKNGPYQFSTIIEFFARQVKFLADSLGYRTRLKEKTIIFRGRPYQSWNVFFNGNVEEIPVKIPRKKANKWTSKIDWQVSGVKIEKDIVDDYYGFELDGDGLFLLEDMTVTHNTKLAVQIALNASSDPCGAHSVGIYSLEMRDIAVARRMVSATQEISTRSMKSGKMSDIDWANFFEAVGELESRKLYLSDASMLTTSELRADIARMKANYGLDLVVLDYLLLMSGYEKLDNETERSTRLSRDIKSIAKDMDVALIAVNSVTKEGMDGGLALKKNLRGSGQLIHDADLIAMLCMDNSVVAETLYKPVKLVFTKVRDVEIGTTVISLLADNARPMFHSAVSQSIQV
jgi:replicative DNA helicase